MTPDKHEIMNESRMADVVLSNSKPYFDRERKVIIDQIKLMYRSGEHSEAKFLACAASLCVLDDLENKMRQTYRKGQTLSQEQYDADARRD